MPSSRRYAQVPPVVARLSACDQRAPGTTKESSLLANRVKTTQRNTLARDAVKKYSCTSVWKKTYTGLIGKRTGEVAGRSNLLFVGGGEPY